VSTSPKVILGRKGWLFYSAEPLGNDYQARRPFTAEELARWGRVLEARRAWLAARGIRYVVVVAPNKETIYPDLLPRNLRHGQGAPTRLDQLMAWLGANSQVTAVDLRRPLLGGKAGGRLYYRTDTHWNNRGSILAYRCVIAALNGWFPTLRALPATAPYDTVCDNGHVGDLSVCLGLPRGRLEKYFYFMPKVPRQARMVDPGAIAASNPGTPGRVVMECPDASLPRVVMFRDSFANELIPFLSEHFRRAVYEWPAGPLFDTGLIERESPDVVIQEFVERRLSGFVPEPSACLVGEPLCSTRAEWMLLVKAAE
jgi:hypothetical protein